MSLVTINNNVNINTNLFKEHEFMYPSSFVKCVKAGATWLASHSNITYQTSVMMRTDSVLYANSGSELIRLGLIDLDKPLSGLTFYDITNVTESRDDATGNIIFRAKCKYKTPLGIDLFLIPIAYFNPDTIKEEKVETEQVENKDVVAYPKEEKPVTNDNGSNNSNTQQEYYPADKLITRDDLEAAMALIRSELQAGLEANKNNVHVGVADGDLADILKELSTLQEVISNLENNVYASLDTKVDNGSYRTFEEEVRLQLASLPDLTQLPDMSNVATKTELINYATKEEVNDLVTKEVFEQYKQEVDDKLTAQPAPTTPEENTTEITVPGQDAVS